MMIRYFKKLKFLLLAFVSMNKEPKHIILHEPNQKEELEKYFKDTCESLQKEGLKQLPSHYMYDEEGSRLVAKVNETEEYYLWRCER